MSSTDNNNLIQSIERLHTNESLIYFLVYDTKNNPRASVKYIYDMALTLKENGFNSKLLVEDKSYGGVKHWLGDQYDGLEVVSIKDDKVELNVDDTLVIPEFYSNTLQQLANIRCSKIMLIQQTQYLYDTLPIGSKWVDFGFDRAITTTQQSKKHILEYFPESIVYIIPPIIGDNFKPAEKPLKPYVAIHCRDRVVHRKLISQFYLKYPQLRWVTFRDMIQMSYDEFSEALKECSVSLWVDDQSTFGTFPLESMKCGVPIVGKIPNVEPDWLGENGMWTYDEEKLVEILGTYILAWIEGIELTSEVRDQMRDTLLPYETEVTKTNIISIFNSLKNSRIESIKKVIEKLEKTESE